MVIRTATIWTRTERHHSSPRSLAARSVGDGMMRNPNIAGSVAHPWSLGSVGIAIHPSWQMQGSVVNAARRHDFQAWGSSAHDVMNELSTVLQVEHHGGWTLRFSSIEESGSRSAFAVDIILGGAVKGRRSAARSGLDEKRAVEALRVKALEWIADYEARDHSGSTGFADF